MPSEGRRAAPEDSTSPSSRGQHGNGPVRCASETTISLLAVSLFKKVEEGVKKQTGKTAAKSLGDQERFGNALPRIIIKKQKH